MNELLSKLVDVCHDRLKTSQLGFDYLINDRGITVDTIRTEKIGFVDVDIARAFVSKIDTEEWTHDKDYYIKMLADRVLLPIRDDCGLIVGVSTKVPVKGSKGWWNSPFKKENVLYGLNRARTEAFRKNKIYIVEGYADAITLWQHGLHNVVAVMGTAFTKVQQGLVLRYCTRVCICFDTDLEKDGQKGGGQKGLERIIQDYGKKSRFDMFSAVVLPIKENEDGTLSGEDPDNFVNENGIKKFLDLERRIILY
jgi:DNA primase